MTKSFLEYRTFYWGFSGEAYLIMIQAPWFDQNIWLGLEEHICLVTLLSGFQKLYPIYFFKWFNLQKEMINLLQMFKKPVSEFKM